MASDATARASQISFDPPSPPSCRAMPSHAHRHWAACTSFPTSISIIMSTLATQHSLSLFVSLHRYRVTVLAAFRTWPISRGGGGVPRSVDPSGVCSGGCEREKCTVEACTRLYSSRNLCPFLAASAFLQYSLSHFMFSFSLRTEMREDRSRVSQSITKWSMQSNGTGGVSVQAVRLPPSPRSSPRMS